MDKFWNQRGGSFRVSKKDTRDSTNFFRGAVQGLVKGAKEKAKDITAKHNIWKYADTPLIGKMYVFSYDAKWKKELQYWDRLPLIFPIDYQKNGNILGLNFHYLPIRLRYKLLRELIVIGGDPKLSGDTQLKLNYQILKAVARSDLIKPTIHSYIPSHIKSRIGEIHTADWKKVVFLPIAKFTKGGKPYSGRLPPYRK